MDQGMDLKPSTLNLRPEAGVQELFSSNPAARHGCGMMKGQLIMTVSKVSLRESVARVADPRQLDVSVQEVFETMLDWPCRRGPVPSQDGGLTPSKSVTAVVGFGGLLSGACIFRVSAAAALKMAARLTGAEIADVDATVQDAIGEICNMLAGSWKSRFPELGVQCGLSVPAVIAGSDYKLRIQSPKFELRHAYIAGDTGFEVTIVCDSLQ